MRHLKTLLAMFLVLAFAAGYAVAADHELAQKSTLNAILKRGELRVGLDAGYMPFEMTDKKGEIVGFDVDVAKAHIHTPTLVTDRTGRPRQQGAAELHVVSHANH